MACVLAQPPNLQVLGSTNAWPDQLRAWPRQVIAQTAVDARVPAPALHKVGHLCMLWRLLSVDTSRHSLLLTALPNARSPRCSVCERGFVKRRRRAASVAR
jgi:hypothetical protein